MHIVRACDFTVFLSAYNITYDSTNGRAVCGESTAKGGKWESLTVAANELN
jgi:hypothetical protein